MFFTARSVYVCAYGAICFHHDTNEALQSLPEERAALPEDCSASVLAMLPAGCSAAPAVLSEAGCVALLAELGGLRKKSRCMKKAG